MRLLTLLLAALPLLAQHGGELRFAISSDPKTLHPLMAADDNSEVVRYLTGGVLLRWNRKTQKLEPELAESWRVQDGGRRIQFQLRKGLQFADGSPLDAEDVRHTLLLLADPKFESGLAQTFRAAGAEVRVAVESPLKVSVTFPGIHASIDRLFDGIAILSSRSPMKERAAAGAFQLAEHKSGSHLLLKRNPNYWKKDSNGRRLPYLDAIRIDIQANADLQYLRFRRGELHFLLSTAPDTFERLERESPTWAVDAGPSLESEMLWFNLNAQAPLPEYKKVWFASREFRQAISAAIHRADLARLAYRGNAEASSSPAGAANTVFHNARLRPQPHDPAAAAKLLREAGFQRDGGGPLTDAQGHPVEFSLITNHSNKARQRISALIQQDLAKIGVKLNLVPLDFPSLVERLTRSRNYETCLLSLSNIDPDPVNQSNLWLSSGSNHPWNPAQKSPATPWEAEIDKLMRTVAVSPDIKKRKAAFDRVQEIVWHQAPVLYLVTPHALTAISPAVRNASPVALRPRVFWNAEYLALDHRMARAQ
jgi:peptide/nickel transport system substrate-binding protein